MSQGEDPEQQDLHLINAQAEDLEGEGRDSSITLSSMPASHHPGFAHGCEDPGDCSVTPEQHSLNWEEATMGIISDWSCCSWGTEANSTVPARDEAKSNHILVPILQSPQDTNTVFVCRVTTCSGTGTTK